MTYKEFLESKIILAQNSGFEVEPGEVNKACKDKTVIDGYMPTQDYYYCRGERFDRKKV